MRTLPLKEGAFWWPALLCAAWLAPVFLSGRTIFWGDLTYLHHPWRALSAQLVQSGELPLWNPFIYLGMPLAGQMQGAAWYPGTLPFMLFGFATGLAVFQTLHYWLAGFFTWLWLKRLRFSSPACAAGAAAFLLAGGLVSRAPFLNHLSTLALLPSFLLFAESPALLGLSLALAFLSGYPPMLLGAAAAALALSLGWRLLRSPLMDARALLKAAAVHCAAWGLAALLALGLGACLLLPALELAAGSRRGSGIDPEESLTWSFAGRDMVQLTAPPLIPEGDYSPSTLWWKTSYFGLGTLAAAAAGFAALGAPLALFSGAYGAACGLLLLGANLPLSHWLWTHAAPLRYIRYPGNTAYLLIPLISLLAAAGLHRRRFAGAWAVLIAAELLAYACRSQPLVERSYFTDPGPLVLALRKELQGHRYLLSGRALQWQRGQGREASEAVLDLKHRLYGLTNMPYRLRAIANFGEPLTLQGPYDFMDFLFTRPGLAAAAPWLDWADGRLLMTRERLPSGGLDYLGDSLWHLYRAPGSAGAYWLNEREGSLLPATAQGAPPLPRTRKPLELVQEGTDRLRVHGSFAEPGWLFLSEPRAPGWKAFLNGRPRALASAPALTAFQKLRVPAGDWSVLFRYDPASWRLGLAVSLAFLCALGAYWYNRLLRSGLVIE